jgi:hypothetical protein
LHRSEFHLPLRCSKFLIGEYRGGLVQVKVGAFTRALSDEAEEQRLIGGLHERLKARPYI